MIPTSLDKVLLILLDKFLDLLRIGHEEMGV